MITFFIFRHRLKLRIWPRWQQIRFLPQNLRPPDRHHPKDLLQLCLFLTLIQRPVNFLQAAFARESRASSSSSSAGSSPKDSESSSKDSSACCSTRLSLSWSLLL